MTIGFEEEVQQGESSEHGKAIRWIPGIPTTVDSIVVVVGRLWFFSDCSGSIRID